MSVSIESNQSNKLTIISFVARYFGEKLHTAHVLHDIEFSIVSHKRRLGLSNFHKTILLNFCQCQVFLVPCQAVEEMGSVAQPIATK